MQYSSKILNANNNIYAGILTNGKPIVYISGQVNDLDCQWALEMLDDLMADGNQEVVFDYSGVENVSLGWFESQIRTRESQSKNKKITHRNRAQAPAANASFADESQFQQANPSLFRMLSNALSLR